MSVGKRLLVAHILGATGWKMLEERPDVEAVPFPNTISRDDFLSLLSSAERIDGIILGLTGFGGPELGAARGLQVVSRIGVGFDAVDVEALTRGGVPLLTVGTANATAVAEHALHAMLTLAKRSTQLNALVREGRWAERLSFLPTELDGKTVLIIGFGRIGTRVAQRTLAMEMNVLVFDPYVGAEVIRAAGCTPVNELDGALARADFVTIHCPKSRETLGMLNARRLSSMRPTAYLINTARGGIVDEIALQAALASNTIAGAALDVFSPEPPANDHPLLGEANVTVSPHLAGVTAESIERMAMQAVRNALSVLDGFPLLENVINPQTLAPLQRVAGG